MQNPLPYLIFRKMRADYSGFSTSGTYGASISRRASMQCKVHMVTVTVEPVELRRMSVADLLVGLDQEWYLAMVCKIQASTNVNST